MKQVRRGKKIISKIQQAPRLLSAQRVPFLCGREYETALYACVLLRLQFILSRWWYWLLCIEV